MEMADLCIYTIKGSASLQECIAKGGSDAYSLGQKWARGYELLQEAKRAGRRLLLLFGDADDILFLIALALIDDIVILGTETTFSFSALTLLDEAIPKSNLLKENGDPLPDHYRRAYAVCRTPSFLAHKFPLLFQPAKAPDADLAARVQEVAPAGELGAAARRLVGINRIVRDTAVVKAVKQYHQFQCQVCGIRLDTPSGPYAEGAHVRPLGSPHDGPDNVGNVLCLCPNHHVLFDAGAFSVRDDFTLVGMDGTLRLLPAHKVDTAQLGYHRTLFNF